MLTYEADSTRQAARNKLATRFAKLDALLSKQDYLAGEYGVALPLTPYPHMTTYLVRVPKRPRVQDALRAEGVLK